MEMGDIKKTISSDVLKKIFGNAKNGANFYYKLTGQKIKSTPSNYVWEKITSKWNYKKALSIVRELFKESKKYKNGKGSEKALDVLLKEWEQKNLGGVEWPFGQSPNAFDMFVQSLNSECITRDKKDEKVKTASVKYRRIKEINTARNDFIETLIFLKNEKIMPTLSHVKGVDFFIDGTQFDQKVSRSVTTEFKTDFGDNWKNEAIKSPEVVAKYLYTYQNETRFDYKPRVLCVYLEEKINAKNVKDIIEKINFEKPIDISFTYTFENKKKKSYKTKCFIVLLHNNI